MSFSSVDLVFLGVGGIVADRIGGESVGGEAGRGLSVLGFKAGGLTWLLLLLLVEGRSPTAKLTPESARRSVRRDSSAGVKYSGPVTWAHCSIMALVVRRYLSTTSLIAAQPLSSPSRLP